MLGSKSLVLNLGVRPRLGALQGSITETCGSTTNALSVRNRGPNDIFACMAASNITCTSRPRKRAGNDPHGRECMKMSSTTGVGAAARGCESIQSRIAKPCVEQ